MKQPYFSGSSVRQSSVTVKDFKVSFGALSASKIDKSQGFQTTASVSGGTSAYTYRFGYTKDGKKTYVRNSTTGAPYMTYTYKFSAEGTYVPFIEVMDGESLYASAVLSAVTVTD